LTQMSVDGKGWNYGEGERRRNKKRMSRQVNVN